MHERSCVEPSAVDLTHAELSQNCLKLGGSCTEGQVAFGITTFQRDFTAPGEFDLGRLSVDHDRRPEDEQVVVEGAVELVG